MDPVTDAELRGLLDKQAITELVHAYCRACDRRDIATVRTLYHPDALDDHGSYYQGTAEGYFAMLPALMEPVIRMQHHITTINIRLDGDYAESEAYGLAIHQLKGEDGPSDLIVGTRFTDRLERRAGVWKFAHRAHTLDWTIQRPSAMTLEGDDFAASPIGRPGADDPSFKFFRLFQYES